MKEVKISTGIIEYQDEGTGPTLVFAHGTMANGHTWRKVLGPLSRQFRCIVPHLPLGAHNYPMAADTDLNPPGIAAIINEFTAAIGLKQFTLVGNDTGGAYAQVFAQHYPERLNGLILINADALEVFPPLDFAFLPYALRIPGFTSLLTRLFRIKWLVKSRIGYGLLAHSLTAEQVQELYLPGFMASPEIRRDLVKVTQGWKPRYTLDAATALREFKQPVLVLWGLDDKVFPLSLGKRVAEIFSDVRMATVESALIYVQEDQPEFVVEHVNQFMFARRPAAKP